MNKDALKQQLLEGEPAPRLGQTLSEICDNEERDAVFNHTMQSGVFKNIHDSPLKEKLPKTLQMWTPGESGGFATFGREHEDPMTRWPSFKPKTPNARAGEGGKPPGLNIGTDF